MAETNLRTPEEMRRYLRGEIQVHEAKHWEHLAAKVALEKALAILEGEK